MFQIFTLLFFVVSSGLKQEKVRLPARKGKTIQKIDPDSLYHSGGIIYNLFNRNSLTLISEYFLQDFESADITEIEDIISNLRSNCDLYENISPTQPRLVLKHQKDSKLLVKCCNNLLKATKLFYSVQFQSYQAISQLSGCLDKQATVSINLRDTDQDSINDMFDALSKIKKVPLNIQGIDLSNLALDDQEIKTLLDIFTSTKSIIMNIRHLSLAGNNITRISLVKLSDFLMKSVITSLNLESNGFSCTDLSILRNSIINSKIEKIRISGVFEQDSAESSDENVIFDPVYLLYDIVKHANRKFRIELPQVKKYRIKNRLLEFEQDQEFVDLETVECKKIIVQPGMVLDLTPLKWKEIDHMWMILD